MATFTESDIRYVLAEYRTPDELCDGRAERPADAEAGWAGYLSGEFGVFLRSVTPESMAAEKHLVRRIEALVAAPAGTDPAWPSELRTTVDALDAPDRPFTDFDRQRWGETSRIRHIERVRARFPAAFGEARASATTATS